MALALDDNKKKAFLLAGIAGVLGIGAVFLLLPKGKDTTTTAPPPTAPAAVRPGAPSAPSSGGEGEESPSAAGGAVATGPVVVAAAPYRNDPFVPFFTDTLKPPPPPPPLPTPRPTPRPVFIPPPIDIPAPRSQESGGVSAYPLPSTSGNARRTTALVGLPSARIPRLTNVPTAPRVQIAPPSVGGGSQPALERSPNKRLAGVVIGDSVRALLEVEDASASGGSGGEMGDGMGQAPPKTYIVQPGQEIPEEGIKVLRIERTTEGGRTRVRMVVTENGVLRYIDLREGNTQAGGASGYPGASGGYPGSSGGYPGGSGGYPGGFQGGRGGAGRGGGGIGRE